MGQDHAQENAALIERIAGFARQRLGGAQAAQAERFVRYYYEASNADDLLALPLDDLYGAALSHWKLAQLRRPGEVLLHVYNTRYDEHGWQYTHAVIEVVMDDMPFLVDSISLVLLCVGFGLLFLLFLVLCLVCGGRGVLVLVLPCSDAQSESVAEAVMRFEVTRQTDAAALNMLRDELLRVLADVRAVVADWAPMRARIAEIVAALEAQSLPIPSEDQQEAGRVLRWGGDDHFTFIGFRAYDLVAEGGQV